MRSTLALEPSASDNLPNRLSRSGVMLHVVTCMHCPEIHRHAAVLTSRSAARGPFQYRSCQARRGSQVLRHSKGRPRVLRFLQVQEQQRWVHELRMPLPPGALQSSRMTGISSAPDHAYIHMLPPLHGRHFCCTLQQRLLGGQAAAAAKCLTRKPVEGWCTCSHDAECTHPVSVRL